MNIERSKTFPKRTFVIGAGNVWKFRNGDPARRMILQRLARGDASVSEMAEPHDMALPSFMEHLKKLEAAGLVTSQKKGRTRTCELTPNAFAPTKDWLSEQSEIWGDRLDRFDECVTNLMKEDGK